MEKTAGLPRGALHKHALAALRGTPARLAQPPLEAVAMRVLDPARNRPPLARQQLHEFLDEQAFLHQKIAVLEQDLADARQFAHYDEVTGIPNRRLLEDRFQQARARSDRQAQSMAVLFIDIDGFKGANDAHGHVAGDDLLRQIATRLAGCIRTSDTVCRYGGDEFVVLLPESDGRPGAIAATGKIREQLAAPYFVRLVSIKLPASIGMALYPADGIELDRLIEEADSAMYREKARKRGEQHNPQRCSVALPRPGADRKAASLGRTRAIKKAESGGSPQEDAFTNEGAPPPAASRARSGSTARNSQ